VQAQISAAIVGVEHGSACHPRVCVNYILNMPDPGQIRVSDAERERLVEELHEHTVAGRLTAEEYEQRLEDASMLSRAFLRVGCRGGGRGVA